MFQKAVKFLLHDGLSYYMFFLVAYNQLSPIDWQYRKLYKYTHAV